MSKENIAYCGVNCAACADFIKSVCPGCRKTLWTDEPCMPVSCCMKKNISSCGECGSFPCHEMKEFYEESDGHRLAYQRLCEYRKNKG